LRAKPRFVARDEAVESTARKEEELARPERFELPTYCSGVIPSPFGPTCTVA
jgi:hypothetical protein